MRIKSGLTVLLILLLVMGLALTGCGRNDDKGNDPGGNDPGGNDPGGKNPGNGDTGNDPVDVDFSDPEAVALAFLADFTAGKLDRANQYLTGRGQKDLEYFIEDYAENPYLLELWKLIVGHNNAEIVARGSSTNLRMYNIDFTKPHIDSLFSTLEGEELLYEVLLLITLSGVDYWGLGGEAARSNKKFTADAWDKAFGALRSAIEKLPQTKQGAVIELVEVNGKWKVDKYPFTNIFD